jgi:predicted aspartyl protease
MRKRRGMLWLVAVIAAIAPAQAQQACAPVSSLPLLQRDGNLLVEVAVNGRPAIFLLDTGGVTTVIGTRLAARLNLPTRPTAPRIDVRDAGGVRADRYVTARSLTLGTRRLRPRNYMLGAMPDGIDGSLAPDLLRDFDLGLDFAAGRLELYVPGACAAGPPGDGAFSSVALLDSGWARRIRVEAVLDGKTLRATLDTGARQSYVAASAARDLFGLVPETQAGRARGIFGGTLAVRPHDFASLRIGDIAWENPRLHLATPEDGFDGAPLLLGLQQLQGLRLFAAYSENRLYISQSGRP